MKNIFKWLYRPKQKGEDIMSNKVEKQITKLASRISEISDKISVMERDVTRFKQQVSEDMKALVKVVRENR
tara:strand:+ start:343 stop:555 length:213 start_codon:yes stop_codon:yes gene_type:complete